MARALWWLQEEVCGRSMDCKHLRAQSTSRKLGKGLINLPIFIASSFLFNQKEVRVTFTLQHPNGKTFLVVACPHTVDMTCVCSPKKARVWNFWRAMYAHLQIAEYPYVMSIHCNAKVRRSDWHHLLEFILQTVQLGSIWFQVRQLRKKVLCSLQVHF